MLAFAGAMAYRACSVASARRRHTSISGRVRTVGWLSHRLDLIRRRFYGCDGGKRGGARLLPRSFYPWGRRRDAILCDSAALRIVDVLAADHGGHCRDCADGIGTPSRRGPRAAGQQRPRDSKGHRAARLHRPGVLDWRRIERESAAERRQRDVDRGGCLRSSR